MCRRSPTTLMEAPSALSRLRRAVGLEVIDRHLVDSSGRVRRRLLTAGGIHCNHATLALQGGWFRQRSRSRNRFPDRKVVVVWPANFSVYQPSVTDGRFDPAAN